MLTALGSAGVLAVLVQTPGLSHLFGCRPLGPLGWAGAVGSSAAATATSALLSAVDEKVEAFVAKRTAPLKAVVKQAADAKDKLAGQLEALAKPAHG